MQIVIFEDEKVHGFRPLVHFKPVYGLFTGCRNLLQKFCFYLGADVTFSCHLRRYLQPYYRSHLPVFQPGVDPQRDILLVNGRLLCDEKAATIIRDHPPDPGQCLMQGDELVLARVNEARIVSAENMLPDYFDTEQLAAESETVVAEGFRLLRNIWDPVAFHPGELHREAFSLELGRISGRVSSRAGLENPESIFVGEGAVIKAGALLDAEEGFVYVSPGAVVEPQAVLAGNVFAGEFSCVRTGANLHSNVFVGRASKAGGEIEDAVVEPYANKQHEGFLGHSYISSWCNLGAGTNTSDLRNNYGKVKLQVENMEFRTGEQFLGLLMGEHAKCSINSMFNTGTVAGASSNIFGGGFPPKYIPSFSWGGPGSGFQPYDIEKAVETARVVMGRRNIRMCDAYETMFRYVAAVEQDSGTAV
ncbi:MAG: GlmU family protein [Chlorobium sp.]|nr:GlmU family protein [Chlorobium sp.]MCW8815015.1 GlmU family protein [Chlorobium sp.]MCW8819601.1 GlmU family protein [Ignavibacteriaceae bacterium]